MCIGLMPVLTVTLMHSVSLSRPYNVNVSVKTRKTKRWRPFVPVPICPGAQTVSAQVAASNRRRPIGGA